ncbi:MAG: radical SAM protein [Candidatus Woesearchaeota archaeon]|jgi:radical SAM superfamily enzyme YgiQ (UPF0313 family)
MFKKVLLMTPWFRGKQYTAVLTAGSGYIAESLLRSGIDYKIFDGNLVKSTQKLMTLIQEYKPDLIAMSLMSINYIEEYRLIKELKKNFPEIKIAVGGPHASTFRELMFHDNNHIDYAVILEGEETILELCNGKPLEEIKGLMYKKEDEVKYNGDRPFFKDLDNIAWPTYTGYELEKYPDLTIPIVSSRGCPYGCTFCPVKVTIGRVFRVRSPKNVVEEIDYWYKKGIKSFGFVDDNFTFYKERVLEICSEIESRGIKARFNLGNGIRADKVDYELLKRMKDVGFCEIAIGVESANDHVLKSIKKGESLEDIDKAVKTAVELGFEVGLFFIIGSPGETKEDILRSFEFALKYPVDYAYFYNIIPFPNSELYDYLNEHNFLLSPYYKYLNDSNHWNGKPAFITKELNYLDRVKLFNHAKKITKRIQIKRIKLRLRKLGILATPAAHVVSVDFIQRRVMTNRFTKRIIINIKEKFWK